MAVVLAGWGMVSACCASVPQAPVAGPVQRLYHVSGQPLCTVFSVGRGRWLTAAHCAGNGEVRVAGLPTEILATDLDRDLLLLGADLFAPPLTLGAAPVAGDEIHITGYPPQFNNAPMVFFGRVAYPLAILERAFTRGDEVMVLHEGGGPGTSGAPVTTRSGLVGVVRGGLETPSVVVLAVPYAHLKAFLRAHN